MMKFISYAQNFEDVMLWRALKHVDKGFYIDVGANDPEVDSVTKAFYDRGWHGINVEPVSEWHEKLQKDRPRDINLKVAAGNREGSLVFYEIPGTALSTSNEAFIEDVDKIGYKSKKIKVPVVRLTTICEQHSDSDIHFLKIDAEGMEKSVIDGIDFSRFRPWVLLIESNIPSSTEENYEEWEDSVLTANYLFAYADGLNRFYIAKEHPELLDALKYPPNILDNFIKADANHAAMRYQAVINSRTWRMTASLRWVMDKVKWFVRGSVAWITLRPGSRPRRTATRLALMHLRNWVSQRPRIKRRIKQLLSSRSYLFKFFNQKIFKPLISNQSSQIKDICSLENLVIGKWIKTSKNNSGNLTKPVAKWYLDNCRLLKEGSFQSIRRPAIGKSKPLVQRILQLTTYNIDTPSHGGMYRCNHIRTKLREKMEVETLSFEWGLAEDFSSFSVVLDQDFIRNKNIHGYLRDMTICDYFDHNENIFKIIGQKISQYLPDMIILEQPFLWPLLRRLEIENYISSNTKVIYSSHNVEVILKKDIYSKVFDKDQINKYLARVDYIEKNAIRTSDSAIAVSEIDAHYIDEYNSSIPVGIFKNGGNIPLPNEKSHYWEKQFANGLVNWVFVGSWHEPNIQGLKILFDALEKLQGDGYMLWVLGGAGDGLIQLLGKNYSFKKHAWLQVIGPVESEHIDVAIINSCGIVLPILEGSGSNLKTAQALLSNKCILGTKHSFRSFESTLKEPGVYIADSIECMASMMLKIKPDQNYVRSQEIMKFSWASTLEFLPEFIDRINYE